MTYDEFNAYCQSLSATTYVVQWGGAHVWKVGGKVFAIGGWAKTDGQGKSSKQEKPKGIEKLRQPAFTFKTSELNFNILQGETGYRPAPYLAARGMKWIQQYQSINEDEALKYYLQESHRLVSLGLTKKLQKELGLNQ